MRSARRPPLFLLFPAVLLPLGACYLADAASFTAGLDPVLGLAGSGGSGGGSGGGVGAGGGVAGAGTGGGHGGKSGSGGVDGGSSSSCDQAAQALCQHLALCSSAALGAVLGDVATCLDRLSLRCQLESTQDGFSASMTDLKSCLDAVPALACSLPALPLSLGSACGLRGNRAEGAACRFDDQCATGRCSTSSGASPCGVCEHVAAMGEKCRVGGQQIPCEPGLVCDLNTRQCGPGQQAGQPCEDQKQPCQPGLGCVGGSCAARAQLGESCDPTTKPCAYSLLLTCNGTSKTCVAPLIVAPGELCGSSSSGPTQCKRSGVCFTSAGGGGSGGAPPMTCQAAVTDGAPCGVDGGLTNCLFPAQCVNGTCDTAFSCP